MCATLLLLLLKLRGAGCSASARASISELTNITEGATTASPDTEARRCGMSVEVRLLLAVDDEGDPCEAAGDEKEPSWRFFAALDALAEAHWCLTD
jgi:hypothetical protein